MGEGSLSEAKRELQLAKLWINRKRALKVTVGTPTQTIGSNAQRIIDSVTPKALPAQECP